MSIKNAVFQKPLFRLRMAILVMRAKAKICQEAVVHAPAHQQVHCRMRLGEVMIIPVLAPARK
ncbi:hypothetical protein CA284_18925 [Enterobacter mori]|nr:hypothetical protein CA284_18925 [Enterobacter mori]